MIGGAEFSNGGNPGWAIKDCANTTSRSPSKLPPFSVSIQFNCLAALIFVFLWSHCTSLPQTPVMPALLPVRPLDQWLDTRLDSTLKENLRYEASWYGPINSLLTHVFPLQQRFMIKPQPKLRPVVSEGFEGES
jgi:hypothetical protein